MELRQIQYFMEVAKREHMTKAAEALHVAQSAVSRQISLLEGELGVELFSREGRNVRLTQMGRLFMEHAERGLLEFQKAEQKIKEHLNPETGLIRLGLSTSLSVHTLPMVLHEFSLDHPNITFQLIQGKVSYLIRLIESGNIDIAFVSPVPSQHDSVKSKVLYTERIVVLLPRNHPLADRDSIDLTHLKEEKFVTFRSNLFLQELFQDACRQAGFTPKIAFEGEDMDTIKSLVAAGFGISLLPENAAIYNLPQDVVTVILHAPKVSRAVGVIMPKKRELAPSEQIFFQFLDKFYDRLYRFGQ